MTTTAAQAQQSSLLQELAAELTPSPEELAEALGPPGAKPQGSPVGGIQEARNLGMVMRIPVSVKIILGSAVMPVSSLVKLARGTIIPLDRRVGEPVDVVVNGRVVARGEVVVVDEDSSRFGVSLTEIVGPAEAEKAA
jgi:flagellar motor switch protein FliN/FliY